MPFLSSCISETSFTHFCGPNGLSSLHEDIDNVLCFLLLRLYLCGGASDRYICVLEKGGYVANVTRVKAIQ